MPLHAMRTSGMLFPTLSESVKTEQRPIKTRNQDELGP